MATEQDLIRRMAAGEQDAFGLLVEPYRAELLRFAARQLGADTHLAEDVLQQAMLDAYRSLTAGTQPENARAWLFAIVRNCAANTRRTTRATKPMTEADQDSGQQTPSEQIEQREWMEWLVGAIGQLPERQRDALVGHAFEGRSHKELASHLQTTVLAVKTLLHRARKRLTELRSQSLMSLTLMIREHLANAKDHLGTIGQALATAGVASAVLLSVNGPGTATLLAAGASARRGGTAAHAVRGKPSRGRLPQHSAPSKRRIRIEAKHATRRCLHGGSLHGFTPPALEYAAHHLSSTLLEYTECESVLRRQAQLYYMRHGRHSSRATGRAPVRRSQAAFRQ